ncbi:MAG: Rpn family recombination-promoting nuclease/putative transposase [bacterium]
MEDKIHNPHDSFFKEVLSKKESAIDFFNNYLPPELSNLIDIKTLQIKKDSFIDKELKQFYSDILYQVKVKGKSAYLYLLFEHQSSVDRFITLRLLEYRAKIWRLEIKQQSELKLLSPIIPLVLYHGTRKWNVGGRFSDIISLGDRKELRLYLPDFSYILYDLSVYKDEEIKGNIINRICLHLFKHIFDNDFLLHLERIFPLLKNLLEGDKTALEYLETVLRYIMSTREDASREVLKKIMEKTISRETGGVVMTVAEQLIEEGREEGREEGIEKGREEGELIGSIRAIQLMKGLFISGKKELENLSIEELGKKLEELTGNQGIERLRN